MVGKQLGCTFPMLIVLVSVSRIGQFWSHIRIQALFWKVVNHEPVDRSFWFLGLTEYCQCQKSHRYSHFRLNKLKCL